MTEITEGSKLMQRFIAFVLLCVATVAAQPAWSQTPAQPTFATTKVDGTDNVYVFRYLGHQAMFVVTSAGVIATDPVGSMPGRAMIDSYPIEWEDSAKKVLAMDWERLIPGHPGPGGRLGTKKDVQDILTMLQDMSAEVKASALAGKCWDTAEKEVKLEKYAGWPGYEPSLPMIVRRYCGLWGRGT